MLLRPVQDTEEDAETVRLIAAASFGASHAAKGLGPLPEPTPEQAARSREKIPHLARTDAGGGSWLAEDADGRPVGAAQALLREGTWGLALLVVLPEAQGRGVGLALLQRASEYGGGCLRRLLCSSRHPRRRPLLPPPNLVRGCPQPASTCTPRCGCTAWSPRGARGPGRARDRGVGGPP